MEFAQLSSLISEAIKIDNPYGFGVVVILCVSFLIYSGRKSYQINQLSKSISPETQDTQSDLIKSLSDKYSLDETIKDLSQEQKFDIVKSKFNKKRNVWMIFFFFVLALTAMFLTSNYLSEQKLSSVNVHVIIDEQISEKIPIKLRKRLISKLNEQPKKMSKTENFIDHLEIYQDLDQYRLDDNLYNIEIFEKINDGELESAITVIDQYTEERNKDIAKATLFKARIKQLNYEYEDALNDVNLALTYDTTNAKLYLVKSQLFVSLGNFDGSLNAISKGKLLASKNKLYNLDDFFYIFHKAYLLNQDLNNSIYYLEKCIDSYTNSNEQNKRPTKLFHYISGLAYSYLFKGDFDKGFENVDELIKYSNSLNNEYLTSLAMQTRGEAKWQYFVQNVNRNDTLSYNRLKENLFAGAKILEEAIYKMERVLIEEYPQSKKLELGYFYNTLSQIFAELSDQEEGNYSERSIEMAMKSMNIISAIYKPDNPIYASELSNIGLTYLYAKKYKESRIWLDSSINTFVKFDHLDHSFLASAYHNRASIAAKNKDSTIEDLLRAKEDAKRAISISEKNIVLGAPEFHLKSEKRRLNQIDSLIRLKQRLN